MILVLVLGIAIVLSPVAPVFYLNTSGLYQIIGDARQRPKRIVKALREAEESIGGSS